MTIYIHCHSRFMKHVVKLFFRAYWCPPFCICCLPLCICCLSWCVYCLSLCIYCLPLCICCVPLHICSIYLRKVRHETNALYMEVFYVMFLQEHWLFIGLKLHVIVDRMLESCFEWVESLMPNMMQMYGNLWILERISMCSVEF